MCCQAKAANPERLNLDRRNLPVVPLLDGEQMLRLLNVQNNLIRRIEHLTGLPNLIFLDLYNNRIEVSAESSERVAPAQPLRRHHPQRFSMMS
ncbi:hypothetical protein PINS_up000030 [Pythium insidiosum]|nr:hypothetical protein PINS_up000030 [Pythium insidiosum]